jgi:hypothetical protein
MPRHACGEPPVPLIIFNRRTTSQAGRRGFDPRLPLYKFKEVMLMGNNEMTAALEAFE